MRLLNTTTYILEEFTESDIPRYAILSHRWGNQEITFQDIQHFKNFRDYFKTRKSTKSEGWSKIKHSCEQAVLDGLQWIWVDSCCIDKMSSAELSEAINSMFNWYRKANVCYAYLSDVFIPMTEDTDRASYEFRNSRWFRRGWTLQELLAPRKLVFFSRYWTALGSRKDLWYLISKTTGIKDEVGWEMASVAQKMSWASKRETTRSEDKAYSLMGLFGVNMPPLYGEGENAFIRLQNEILRTSDDESIFAWRDDGNTSGGLLARSPDAFQHSDDIKRFDSIHYEKPPYSMTNKGLSMEFSLVTATTQGSSIFDADDTYLAPLQCRQGNDHSMMAILLRCIRGNQYRRISSGELISLPSWNHQMLSQIARRRVVQVKQEDDFERSFQGFYQYKFSVASNILSLKGFEVTDRYSSILSSRGGIDWDHRATDEQRILIDHVGEQGVTVALEFTKRDRIEDSAPRGSFVGDSPKIDSSDVDTHSTITDDPEAEFARREAQFAKAIADNVEFDFELVEAQSARSVVTQAETDKFILIFNIYATRARLGILIPKREEDVQALLERLFNRRGDWMTAGQDLLPEPKLMSGARITAQLTRNQNELGLRSYEAQISFEEAVELPNNEILPYQVLPRYPELENTEIPFINRDPASRDLSIGHHLSGFLQHKDLERIKGEHGYDEHNQAFKTEQSEIQSPSHSMQLEIEELRQPSVSPVLPAIHRFSEFGDSLPWLRSEEEEPPPLPIPHISGPTFTFTDVNPFAEKRNTQERSSSVNGESASEGPSGGEDSDEDDDEDEGSGPDDEEDNSQDEAGANDVEINGNSPRKKSRKRGQLERKRRKARRILRKGKGVES